MASARGAWTGGYDLTPDQQANWDAGKNLNGSAMTDFDQSRATATEGAYNGSGWTPFQATQTQQAGWDPVKQGFAPEMGYHESHYSPWGADTGNPLDAARAADPDNRALGNGESWNEHINAVNGMNASADKDNAATDARYQQDMAAWNAMGPNGQPLQQSQGASPYGGTIGAGANTSANGTYAPMPAGGGYPADIGYSPVGSMGSTYSQAPGDAASGAPWAVPGAVNAGGTGFQSLYNGQPQTQTYGAASGGAPSYTQTQGFPGTSSNGAYNPSGGGVPGGAAGAPNSTWWGDPAQASLENAFNQFGGAFLNPTNTQQLNGTNPYGQQLGGEILGRNASALYGNTTNSQNNLAGLNSQVNRPSELVQNAGQLGDIFGGAGNAQNYFKQAQGQLNTPGALEQFAASSLNGTNPYYERLGQQGRAAIDQSAASRGAYGAGGSLAALGNYQGALDAANFQNQGQLQGAAQQAQQARVGLGGTLSQSADSSALGQGNALSSMYQNMFGDRMQAQGLGVTGNQAADQSNIARLAGMTNMVNNGDQTTLARLAGQLGLANSADTQGLNSLNSYFNQAGNAQQAGGQRVNSQQDRALQEAIAQAGLYGGFYGQGGQQSVDAGVGSANAGANAAGLTGQGENSGLSNLFNLFSLYAGGGAKK